MVGHRVAVVEQDEMVRHARAEQARPTRANHRPGEHEHGQRDRRGAQQQQQQLLEDDPLACCASGFRAETASPPTRCADAAAG